MTSSTPLDGQLPRQCACVQVKNGADRLPAARAVLAAVRRDAAARRWRSSCSSPRNISASPPTSPTSARCGRRCSDADTFRAMARLDRRPGDRRVAQPPSPHRDRRRRQYRQRPQLDRLAVQPGQLVRLWPASPGSGLVGARHRRGMDADDLGQRPGAGRADRRHDDGIAPGGGRLHDALGLAHQMATGHHYGPGPWIS